MAIVNIKRGVRIGLGRRINYPTQLPNLTVWYDVGDVSSMRNNSGSIPTNGDTIKLISDKSGNSDVNCLVLNGVAGNYASAPDSAALSITGDIDVRAWVALNDWTPAARQCLIGKWRGAINDRGYLLEITTAGAVSLAVSNLGTVAIVYTSTANPTVSDYGFIGIRATRVSATGAVEFFTSPDFVTWTKLGNTVAGTAGAIFDSTQILEIGSFEANSLGNVAGLVRRAQIYNGIDGTLAFDANFATFSKLAASGTESSANAATVTINSTGATGARISGARDLYQGTVANQPILTIAASGNYLTFDGSNDYLKSPAFPWSQPETVYFVGSQVTWTNGDYIYDGHTASSCFLAQNGTTPNLVMNAGGAGFPAKASMAVGVTGVLSNIFNSTASLFRFNREAATGSGLSVGTNTLNGLTVGSRGDAGVPTNITVSEIVGYSAAHDTNTQNLLLTYFNAIWRLFLG